MEPSRLSQRRKPEHLHLLRVPLPAVAGGSASGSFCSQPSARKSCPGPRIRYTLSQLRGSHLERFLADSRSLSPSADFLGTRLDLRGAKTDERKLSRCDPRRDRGATPDAIMRLVSSPRAASSHESGCHRFGNADAGLVERDDAAAASGSGRCACPGGVTRSSRGDRDRDRGHPEHSTASAPGSPFRASAEVNSPAVTLSAPRIAGGR
jgi:hypothetical protein